MEITPKEKALDLVSYYYNISSDSIYYGIDWKMAKECAIESVNEIINEINIYYLKIYDAVNRYFFWIEVKQEIEKL